MYSAPPPDRTTAPAQTEAQRNARYTYLTGRLRSRQITMEEATELFGTMQGMLRASEAARLAATRIAAPPPPISSAAPPPRTALPTSSAGDDFFLAGLLAMGAGAGLMAAMARRLSEGAAPAPAARGGTGRSEPPP